MIGKDECTYLLNPFLDILFGDLSLSASCLTVIKPIAIDDPDICFLYNNNITDI